MTLLVGSFDP